METLRLVDVADDGRLVLMSDDGRRFVLPVDAEVRAAVRRDRIRSPEVDRADRPGPREVQARIRAGADADEVAAATGLDVEYVRRFEGPVLAERRHVAELARALPVHRDPGARPSSLETVVVAALADAGHDPDRIRWDSRRVEGTRWDVEVFAGAAVAEAGDAADHGQDLPGAVRATWRIDVATRSLDEVDEAARRLTALDRRRLSPVRDRVFDLEAGRTRRQQQNDADVTASTTASILEALALQRGRRPGEARDDDPDRGSSTGQVAATATAPHHRVHADRTDGTDRPDHRRDRPHPEGQGARIAAFTPRRPVTPVGDDADRARGHHTDPDAVAHDAGSPDGGTGHVPVADATDHSPRDVADVDDVTDSGSEVRAGGDFHEDFEVLVDTGTADPPAAEPSLLDSLDVDLDGDGGAPPRPPAPPVRRNGTPPGPRTVAAPPSPRRVADAGTGAQAPAPQRSSPPAEQTGSTPARRSSKRRRAAVPSWDDIVFGARVDDD